MNLQPLLFILLFGLVQGVLLFLFFVHKKLYRGAYVFLVLYLAAMLLQLTLKVMSKLWLMENWSLFYQSSHWLPLLYGPFIFLFVKYLLQPGAGLKSTGLHFVFPVMVLVALVMANVGALPPGAAAVLFNPYVRGALLAASVITYHAAAFSFVKNGMVTVPCFFHGHTVTQLNWVKHFVIVSLVVCLLIVSALFILYMLYPVGHGFRYLFSALSIYIYWFSYTALTNPVVFSVVKGFAKELPGEATPMPQLTVFLPSKKYANSPMRTEDTQALAASLEKLMGEKKLYLQPELTIGVLAAELQCSRHHLSQVLNDHLSRSFYDYINGLRIDEARLLLSDPRFSHYKIASIAYDAGFNSLSTFNDVFKKYTGKTPSAFRKEMLKEPRQQRV